jgi:uncharacterized delta-60 repeat protein
VLRGGLDRTFGAQGTVALPWTDPGWVVGAVTEPSTGRLLVSAHVTTPERTGTMLARLRADGTPDVAFGRNGVTVDPLPSFEGDVFPDAGGRIVLAGAVRAKGGGPGGLAVARLLPDGSPDPGFGTHGLKRMPLRDNPLVERVIRQADGKFLFAVRYPRQLGIIRVGADGEVDTAFGTRGGSRTQTRATGISDLVQTADGKVLLVAVAPPMRGDGPTRVVLTRYLSQGGIDQTFGSAGSVTRDAAGAMDPRALTAAVLPDGSVTVSGSYLDAGSRVLVLRIRSDGVVEDPRVGAAAGEDSAAAVEGQIQRVLPFGDDLLILTRTGDGADLRLLRYKVRLGTVERISRPGGGIGSPLAPSRLAIAPHTPDGTLVLAGACGTTPGRLCAVRYVL